MTCASFFNVFMHCIQYIVSAARAKHIKFIASAPRQSRQSFQIYGLCFVSLWRSKSYFNLRACFWFKVRMYNLPISGLSKFKVLFNTITNASTTTKTPNLIQNQMLPYFKQDIIRQHFNNDSNVFRNFLFRSASVSAKFYMSSTRVDDGTVCHSETLLT